MCPLLDEDPDDFRQKERIAFRLGVKGGDQLRRWRSPHNPLQEAGDVLPTEATQPQALEVRLTRQLAQRVRERMLARQFDIPIGTYDKPWTALQL
jgi:transposase-like protein